jgi:S-DNA-T family DNA segregation ATPase FtsK/SpoIIIE
MAERYKKTKKNATPQLKAKRDVGKKNTVKGAMVVSQLTPYFLIVIALFLLLCFVTHDMFGSTDALGIVGKWTRNFVCGLFGLSAYTIPFFMGYLGIRWRRFVADGTLASKSVFTALSVLQLSTVIHVFCIRSNGAAFGIFKLGDLYSAGKLLKSSGMIGGFFGELSYALLNVIGTTIVGIALLIVYVIFLIGISPVDLWNKCAEYFRYTAERSRISREEARAAAIEAEAQKELDREAERAEFMKRYEEEKKRKQAREATAAAQNEDKRIRSELKQLENENNAAERAAEKKAAKKLRKAQSEVTCFGETADELDEQYGEEESSLRDGDTIENEFAEDVAAPKKTTEKKPFMFGKMANKTEEQPSPDEESCKEDLEKVFVEPVADPENAKGDPMEVHITIKKIESDEETPDGVSTGDNVPEETREQRTERLSKLNARGDELVKYEFPPFNLLKMESETAVSDAEAEISQNVSTLMKTFSNFKVGIEEISYSRGPTITRYELKPESGTRIRTIANLVDDIALALATSGIRMEAPIPNKSLVGIEVPNKVRANVYARTLIESEAFQKADSRLWACLGKDVAGSPIFFDISKMPHLLIAGATGMGKSVCINTIIISLLYKARPDEVKLILIDPKKVEFGVYNGIPHLHIPVVTDPKKSAGALAWAVQEMERRFELIESVNMRDIKTYNAITAGDPEKEFLPHIVIIIDELADLMMTAADEVETSICRLAQKARAAGIHLIIGTQRPSVDVITGLIKSNIPSRIAFTVASQIDSRTILDNAGAEKLIGKGDMLFNPVGAMKPIRVQGAFISEDEVINITNFVKANSSGAVYNEETISMIDEAAAMCGVKKGSKDMGSVEAGGSSNLPDVLFRKALEISIDNGSVATSMLQRNLNVGYGRAARIIDRMELLNFVSPPRGNKHREVLISREKFNQMIMDGDPKVDGYADK